MTYEEFKNKYNGKFIDWDGQYGPQCWDLAQFYFIECLGVPSWVLSGSDLVSNMLYPPKRNDLDTFFEEIPVTEMYPGDVCIFEYGHIAIFDRWDGKRNWFFSQNPNPCKVMTLDESGMHAFRLKKEEPPKPEITPNVERDENLNQIEVKVAELRVRSTPSLDGEILGYAKQGFYNYYEMADVDGYNWYKIADNQWIAYNEEWETLYPKKEDEYISFKILDRKNGYVLIDLGEMWVKE